MPADQLAEVNAYYEAERTAGERFASMHDGFIEEARQREEAAYISYEDERVNPLTGDVVRLPKEMQLAPSKAELEAMRNAQPTVTDANTRGADGGDAGAGSRSRAGATS
jgi:hypothetical protein